MSSQSYRQLHQTSFSSGIIVHHGLQSPQLGCHIDPGKQILIGDDSEDISLEDEATTKSKDKSQRPLFLSWLLNMRLAIIASIRVTIAVVGGMLASVYGGSLHSLQPRIISSWAPFRLWAVQRRGTRKRLRLRLHGLRPDPTGMLSARPHCSCTIANFRTS